MCFGPASFLAMEYVQNQRQFTVITERADNVLV